ncbi:MAG TPA: 30S ribosomal protein S6 [Nitrospiraceae bacterium]|nr:30S ribosomal protein S6 [Nitrospiraceae bacterium]
MNIMSTYEAIFIINANLPDDETAGVIKKMQDVVAKQGGEIVTFEDWGKKKLAYEVQKQKRGHYVYFRMKGGAAMVSELERQFKLTDTVIRYLIVKLVKELRVRPPAKEKKSGPKKDAPRAASAGPAAASSGA